ncbi:NAD(P)/FAD-dependent oxidoreductase [Lachnospiraceae bacterium LCP25S3_G4]
MKHVIIGAGAAGIKAAETIRTYQSDAEIIIISEDLYVHSRCMLHKYMSGERGEAELNFAGSDFFEKNQIHWLRGKEVIKIIPKQSQLEYIDLKTREREFISFDKLLIATGANSFIPPVGAFREAKNVFGLRHLKDAQMMKPYIKKGAKAVIVGSGLVGLDAAYALLEVGLEVTVVEMAERILSIQLDETGAKSYQTLFEQAGCKFYLGRKASDTIIESKQNIRQLVLDDGTVLDCDFIIVAAGVRPVMNCIKDSGIQGERFIETNDSMETNITGIYAAGDVAGKSAIWPNAMKQGQIAGYNMCGIEMKYLDTYAMKNTINFFGLVTLSLGRGEVKEEDQLVIMEDRNSYKKAILRNGLLDSITLQGNIDYAGLYQYLIKNHIELAGKAEQIFHQSFADYYKIEKDGQYSYKG